MLTRRNFLKIGLASTAGYASISNSRLFGLHLPLAGQDADFFTVAVIADTQNYTDGRHPQPLNMNFFLDQTLYLKEHRKDLNLAFVSHVGDVVQHGDGSPVNYPKYKLAQNVEWENALKAMDILHEMDIPFGMTIGNHDFDTKAYKDTPLPLTSTEAYWKKYFGSQSKYFHNKPWYGGASDEVGYVSKGNNKPGHLFPAGTRCNYGLSSYQTFTAGGRKFLHFALQMEAGDPVLAWAQKVIDAHPDYATMITIHSYLKPAEWGDNKAPGRSNQAVRTDATHLNDSPAGCNSPQDLWKKFISRNNQIFLVLCGHAFTHAQSLRGASGMVSGISRSEHMRIDKNKKGNPVYQVLSDYQGNKTFGSSGGDGWYRFVQFDMDKKQIHFYTLNAHLSRKTGTRVLAGQSVLFSDGTSDFGEPLGFSDFTLAMPAQVLNAAKA